jgi:hypothetical protein
MFSMPTQQSVLYRFTHGFNHQVAHRVICRFGLALTASLFAVGLPTSALLAAAPAQEAAASDDPSLWLVLLPLFAAAIAVERLIEVMWNYIDWTLLNTRGWEPVNLRAAQYTQFKSGTSLVLAIVIGVVIANYTGMRLFDYLRPLTPRLLDSVPSVWDVLITGFVIGAGTKPMHDLLGIITQTKNLLGSSALKQRESAGAMMADAVLKLAQSDAQALIDVPGVGPARLAGGNRRMDDDDEPMPSPISTTDQYIRTIHERTTM